MGRGSDTRMYNPRSESSHMFRENHEEEGTRTGYEDPRDLDNRADKRQAKKEKEDKEERKIRHIKVRSHHLRSGEDKVDEEESPMEDSEYKPRGSVDNPSKQTIPSGAGGFLTSLATQAKGPGAAAGQMIAMSEPMLDAWSELLKQQERLPDDTQLHELGQTDLIRLLQHPNERIAAFADRELQLRGMESHGSVPFLDSASEKEIAEFYEPQFQSLSFDYGNVQPSDVNTFDIPIREYHAERAGDVTEAVPGGMFDILGAREKYDHLKETAPQHLVDDYVQRINNYYQDITNPTYLPFFDLESPAQYTPSQTPESIEDMMSQVDDARERLPDPMAVAGGATGFQHDFQQKNASEPIDHAWSELLKSKPKGLPQGIPHASDTGKSKKERDRDTQSDIARRNRNPVKVMRNPVQSELTTGQHNRMQTALELLEQYGSADRIPPKILAQNLPEFLRTTATRKRKPSVGVKPFQGERIYGGQNIKQRDAHKYIRPLARSQREAITGGEHHDSLLDALNTGQFMSELSTFAENAPAYDRRLEEARRAPLPPEPTLEPQPVQEDKIEPGPLPDTFFVNGGFMDDRQFAAYQAQKNQQQKSEPMDHAWSELLKEEPTAHPGGRRYTDDMSTYYRRDYNVPNPDDVHPEWDNWIQEVVDNPAEYEDIDHDFRQSDMDYLAGAQSREDFFERLHALSKFHYDDAEAPFDRTEGIYRDFTDVPFNEETGFTRSEPMDHVWSELLKSKKEERKRKKEEGAKFRPSTGAFERPRGGFGGRPATPARAKIISRNLPVGRHTGLNEAELAVEMSHRGVASKQPMSKDPQQYRDYMATQEAQKRVGNVRTPYAEHRRFGRPSKRAKSGMPRVPRPRLHPVRAPSIVPPKMKMPRLRKPKMPGMVTMSEDEVTQSDVLKSASDAGYLRILVRELREALRETRDKDRKRKGMGTPDTSGAASNLPNHPSNSHAQTSAPQGGTENEEAEAKMYGADPAQVINARGSNKS
jgi:hypothetical protein